jgi:hypothetical protein
MDGFLSFFRARCVISFSEEMILSTEDLGDRLLLPALASTQIVPIGVGGISVSLEVRPMVGLTMIYMMNDKYY